MLNIPIPAFYLAENERGTYDVLDGLQRLSTIKRFLDNNLKLQYLEYLKDQEGRYFEDKGRFKGIERNYARNILQTQVNVNIIEKASPFKVKFDVFRRLNTGGKPLNKQEIRNSFLRPEVRRLLNRLAHSENFKKATNYSVKTDRMDARELILRFICFWMERKTKSKEWYYNGDMQAYLDDKVELINKSKDFPLQEIETHFKSSMIASEYLFGKYAFRKCIPEHLAPNAKQQLINKSLFTVLSVLLAEEEFQKLKEKIPKGKMAEYLANELKNDDELFGCLTHKTNDRLILEKTFKKIESFLSKYLNEGN